MDSLEAYDLELVRWITIFSSAIALWEYLIHIPKEYIVWRRLFRSIATNTRKFGWRFVTHLPLGHILMLIVRYGLVAEVGLSTTTYFGRPTTCSAVYQTMWAIFCITWGATSLIFLTRVYIIYNKSRRVLAAFGLLWLAVMTLWITIVTQYRASTEEAIPSPYPNCLPDPDKRWRAAGWGGSMLFDASVLVATLFKLRKLGRHVAPRLDGRRSSSQKMKAYILKSCLFYFCGAVFLNGTCFIVELAVPNIITSRIPSPPAFAINPVLAIRVVMSTIRSDEELAEEAVPAMSLPGPGFSSRPGTAGTEKGPPPKYPLVIKQEIERSDGSSRPVSFAAAAVPPQSRPTSSSANSLSSIKANLKHRSDVSIAAAETQVTQPAPLQVRQSNPDIHLDFAAAPAPRTWRYGEQAVQDSAAASDEAVESLEQPPFSQSAVPGIAHSSGNAARPGSGSRTPRRAGNSSSRHASIEPYDAGSPPGSSSDVSAAGSESHHAPRRLTFTITPQEQQRGAQGATDADDVVHIITPMDDCDGDGRRYHA